MEALVIDANDPARLAVFWGEILGREVLDSGDDDGVLTLPSPDSPGFAIDIEPTRHPKTTRNRMHFDLTSPSAEAQDAAVARALELGATRPQADARGVLVQHHRAQLSPRPAWWR